jgi:hypothetical protein
MMTHPDVMMILARQRQREMIQDATERRRIHHGRHRRRT